MCDSAASRETTAIAAISSGTLLLSHRDSAMATDASSTKPCFRARMERHSAAYRSTTGGSIDPLLFPSTERGNVVATSADPPPSYGPVHYRYKLAPTR